jgi:2-methylcitrate dehydratase PrpD
MSESLTRALIGSVRGLRFEDLSEEAREVARHCLLDFVGCAIAGSGEPLVGILVDAVARGEGSSEAGLLGRRERCSRLTAALVNGAAGHALDFDDTHLSMVGHPTVPVAPALLALAEREAVDGRRLLTALVAGIELECRLGLLVGQRHYDLGFHTTATLGAFGAAAACAHLLGLDAERFEIALGLAGTEAAGLKSAFGTMTKPLHAGRAASAGLLAALLARDGFTAATEILETKQGFLETHAGDAPDLSRLDAVRGRFLVRDTLFKYHASCYLTHAGIEAVRRIRDRHGLDPDAVERVTLQVAPSLLRVCGIAEPETGLEGKFSLRVTAALALLGVETGALETYSDERMRDPALVRLRDLVAVETDESLAVTRARVAIHAGGRRLEDEIDTGEPATLLPHQRDRLLGKFHALVAPRLGEERAAVLAADCLAVDRLEAPARTLIGASATA